MRRKFRGEPCAYCPTGIAESADHVFAKKFFLEERRGNLPQVPACKACNGEKADLERYLMAVLPFGGRHTDASRTLSDLVPRRLEENLKLHRQLQQERSRVWASTPTGVVMPAMALPLDGEKLERLFAFVVQGLMLHHWRIRLASDSFVQVLSLTGHGERWLAGKFAMRSKNAISEDLGDGTFRYRAGQGLDNPQVSIWEFTVYGGGVMSGDHDGKPHAITKIGAITGPERVLASAERTAKWQAGLGSVS